MGKQTTTGNQASRVVWDNLEEWVRKKVQEFIQSLLEEEVTELLARKKSERRKAVDSSPGYRNGYGKERRLTLGCGTITLRRPRVRGLLERFESRVLPLFARRSKGVSKLIPQLYLHGLALGDFDLALRGLLGGDAPVSASTVARLKEGWQAEWREWKRRSLEGLQVVYLWVDGVYVKAGMEKEKAALLVVVAGLLDGRKIVLAVEPGYRESWGALANIYPGAPEQRCWNHKMVNVLDKLPKKLQGQAKRHLQDIVYAETREEAEAERDDFVRWCRAEGYRRAGETLLRDWDRMVTFYRFPQEHWRHLRTTNVVKMLLLAEQRFHRLDAPEKLTGVYLEFDFQERNEETETKREEVLALA